MIRPFAEEQVIPSYQAVRILIFLCLQIDTDKISKARKRKETVLKSFSVEQCGLIKFGPRPEVYQRCGRDITVFVNAADKNEVSSFDRFIIEKFLFI